MVTHEQADDEDHPDRPDRPAGSPQAEQPEPPERKDEPSSSTVTAVALGAELLALAGSSPVVKLTAGLLLWLAHLYKEVNRKR
jgi:hypothetical protein